MKKKSRIIALMLCFVLVLTLFAACGDPGEKDPDDPIVVEKGDPFGKYETAITITSVRDIPNPSVVKYPAGEDVTNNIWTKTIAAELGINVTYDWTVDSSQLATRLNAMIAGQQMPDFFLATTAQYQELIEADKVLDIKPYFDAYASDFVKEQYYNVNKDVMDVVTKDGTMKGIPVLASKEFGSMMWIRTDWLKKLGLKEPETIADVLKIAEAFALKDPDGNGKKDTWGIPINGDTSGGLAWQTGFMNSYRSYTNLWVEDGKGGLVYGSTTSQTKKALESLRNMVANGVIDPEFITRDYWANYEQITSGKYGIVFGPYYISISPIQPIVTEDKDAEWKAFPILDEKGVAPMQTTVPLSGYYVINKECKNPEAVIKLLNFWYREFYQSPSSERYKMLVNDGADYTSIYSSTPIQSFCPFANLDAALITKQVLDGKIGVDEMPEIAKQQYNDIKKYEGGDRSMWMWKKVNEALIDVMSVYREKNLIQSDMNMAPPSDTMAMNWASLYALEMETFTKIIGGTIPLDDFDKFVTEWNELGGKTITDEMNAWYK